MDNTACPGCGTDVLDHPARQVVREKNQGDKVLVCLACFGKYAIPEERDGFAVNDFQPKECIVAERASMTLVTPLGPEQLLSDMQEGKISNPLLIACSDMGAPLPKIPAGSSLLTAQNFGHKVPSCAELNFMIATAQLKHIVIYGHSDCQYRRWLNQNDCNTREAAAPLADAEAAVLEQLEQLNKAVFNEQVISPQRLELHAWLYDEESDHVLVYDSLAGDFRPYSDRFSVHR